MWLDNNYYKELLRIIQQMAQGSFQFEQNRLESFQGKKYRQLTDALLQVKSHSQKQINATAQMIESVIDGSYTTVRAGERPDNDYRAVYDKYNKLTKHLDRIDRHIARAQKGITENGKIDSRIDSDELEGKWFAIISNINLILESLSTPIDEITTVINSVARGDLSTKMRLRIDTFEISGDFLNLAQTINTMVDQLAQFASEVTRVAKEVGTDGLLGGQAKVEGVAGTWLDLTNNVNGMANSLTAQVRNIADVTTAVARGDLSQKISVDAKGEILEVKKTVNTMVDQLAQFASEVTRVAKEVGTDGLLGGQARVEGVSGTWLDLTNSVNGMADSLTAQVRNIADVTTAVARGDLSQKITVDARGEILELKKTVNTMVDQLAQFASEVTRVAKEVGTDGLLGGQAKVEGVAGTWLDLTNNVNGMADSLTTQVRNIIEVAIAVASGDLTREIDIDVKGEFLELKDNMNTMIHVLSDSATKNRNQNWIKDGVSLLNNEVLDKDKFKEQVETAITQLSRHVNAGIGALYIYNAEKETLTLEASYAYVKRTGRADKFAIREGVVGQVAYEKKPILLTNVADTQTISTGTTSSNALNTYTAPLIFKEELIGVIELSSHEAFTSLDIEYISSALITLSGSLYASLQSRSTKELLMQSQAQSKALEAQSLRLTEQNKELEIQREEMDRQKRELEKKNKDLETARIEVSRAKELELANKYKSEFLANMSHELRTPLNSMLLLSNSLANTRKLDIDKVNKQASIIYDAGNGLLSLINDVLDLSKIEANLMSLNIEKVHTKAMLDELQQLFAPQAEEKDITLKTSINNDVLQNFVTDRIKLTQVLKNFLSNAIKFTDDHGIIELKAEENREEDSAQRPITISVTDNGIGIEEEKIDLIFEAFRQADGSTSRKYGGTGLGLSISRELVNLLGGRTEVKSEVGVGTTFTVYLPEKIDTTDIDSQLIEEIGQDDDATIKKETPLTGTVRQQIQSEAKTLTTPLKSIVPQGITDDDDVILVVDDDEKFSNIMIEGIHSHGYKVIVAHDGSSAVSLAREYKPKAILLDLVLPGLNGIDVLRVLKADLHTRHIPVKVLSFNEADTDTKKLGAVDFIKKPVSATVLDDAISSLITFANSARKRILTIQRRADELAALLSDKNVAVSIAENTEEALTKIGDNRDIDCIVIDTSLDDIDIFDFLDKLKQKDCTLPVILYRENSFSSDERKNIQNYARTTVLKTAVGQGKLIEEVSLFLHTEKESLDKEKQTLLAETMTRDELLTNKRILIVDDDIKNIFALSAVLEEKNIELVTAQDGQEALNILRDKQSNFDLILMDIMMPVMDGYDAIKKIRTLDKFSNTPIIALTAKAQQEDKQKCLDAGANDYLAKPIDSRQLLYLLKIWTKTSTE